MQARPQLSPTETLFAAELSPRWGPSRRQTAHPDLGLSPNRLLALIPGIRWSASIDSHAAVALCLDNSGSHWCSFIFCILLALPTHTLSSGRVRFGAFEPDLSIGELRSIEAQDPNHKVLLREQVFQVLRMLVEREGKIVTREEIKGRLWADDTVVDFDHSINATIKSLRRALGDSADSPRYIETLGRRGYRLMLPIQYLESAPETALEKDRGRREQSAAETSENTGRVQRRMRSPWWKAAVVLASVVILGGA